MKKLLLSLLIAACALQACKAPVPKLAPEDPSVIPPGTRSYLIGISGFAPAGFPSYTSDAAQAFWPDIESASELYGIHVDWQDTGLIRDAAAKTDLDIELVLGFQSPEDWRSRRNDYLKTASTLLQEYPQITHLSVGNEVNLFEFSHPDNYLEFFEAYTEIYTALKEEFSDRTIYTTFQYDALTGRATLMGENGTTEQTELLGLVSGHIDAVGLTVYPHLQYKDPQDIPDDYFLTATATGKPLAITETGWPARESYGKDLQFLNDQNYTGSPEEQVIYLKRLQQLLSPTETVFVNWLMLNDPYHWENGVSSGSGFQIFDSLALRENDGVPREIWQHWLGWLNQTYKAQ
ncbi:MAG: hypothetical protein TR69_WS6001001108 [candidate division WS6 bacterium OLB20]|uniref:Arabinogalactan endo-beta-1,4-galactanase n=1 Tax=candidate division WS6 bacterium OLB20 TaxID=1617426 RepID=A0A136LZL0_9BACT|nr:MAG: hypothetical protein TR69_WS6001001108 [candidate division WS6 bacterium OLB20]